MRIRFQIVDGAQTRFYDAGEGMPLLLLHGVGMPAEVWISNIPALAAEYRVIAPDLVGCGFTEAGRYQQGAVHPYMLDHLAALMDSLELSSVGLIGSSLGALLAIHLHLRRPEQTPAIVLVSSGSAFNNDGDLESMYQASWKNGRSAYLNPSRDNCVRRMRALLAQGTAISEALLLSQMTSYALPGALDVFDRRMQAMADIASWSAWRVQPLLGKISAKVLALFGAKDPRANLDSARKELAKISGSRLVVFENSRHYPQLDETDHFNEEVLRFLRREFPAANSRLDGEPR